MDDLKKINETQIYAMQFPNIGIVFSRIGKNIYDELLTESIRLRTENSLETDYRENLAGNLNYEYDLIQKSYLLEPIIQQLMSVFEKEYSFLERVLVNVNESKLKIGALWVNFMNRGDFNPPHNHSGVFSFVIWMKIPYNLNEELNVYPKNTSKNASKFSFVYSNTLGLSSTLAVDIDTDYEGIICLFPSQMMHFVNPFFTSDESRISIAGNVHFDNTITAVKGSE